MTPRSRTYVVMGATGHIGKVIAERLLRAGYQVRVMGRSADRLKGFVDQAPFPTPAHLTMLMFSPGRSGASRESLS